MTVAVTRRGTVVHVDMTDDGEAGLPHWREATVEDEGGYGFQLFNEIAQRWGFLRERARTASGSSSSPPLLTTLTDSVVVTFYRFYLA